MPITPEGCIDSDKGCELMPNGVLRFHNNAYFRDFKRAWHKYYSKLTVSKDEDLLGKFKKSIERIETRRIIV